MKEIKDLYKWRSIPRSWVKKLNTVKMSALPNLIYRFNSIPIKIQASYFVNSNKLILKFIWKGKTPMVVNTILKNKVERLTLPNLKTSCRAMVFKSEWHWWKNRQRSVKHNRESSNRPPKYSQLVFQKGEKAIRWRIVFSTNGHRTTGCPHAKKINKSRHSLYIFHKN